MQKIFRSNSYTLSAIAISAASLVFAAPVQAELVLEVKTVSQAMTLDGDTSDWAGVDGITVPLTSEGKVGSVDLKAVVSGDMIYMLATWVDSSENRLHKPYQWNEETLEYKATKEQEDRFAISLKMSGNFTPNKFDGNSFVADVWHWKAQRSDTAGVAHDKMWRVDVAAFPKSKKYKGDDGNPVYLLRSSDAGDKLYKSIKYDLKDQDKMPRYKVNMSAKGSIVDVKAKGIWKDGKWTLELARKLNTGNADDVVIPTSGMIETAVALFNGTGSRNHSSSEKIILKIN